MKGGIRLEVYLDNSATTKVCPQAVSAVTEMLTENYGNPSSTHRKGLDAGEALITARKQVAGILSCSPDEIYFTTGGSIANNTAIYGAVKALRRRGNRIVTTSIEHPSVLRCMQDLESVGFEVIYLKPNRSGSFSQEDLFNAVNKNTILVSMMAVNNEIGVINPVSLAAKAVRQAGSPALVHCDAVQGFGKIALHPAKDGIDLMSVSAHKIHGPKGAGALYIRKGVQIKPHILGGGQENGMVSGTEAMPAIAGFGAACAAIPDTAKQLEKTTALRNYTLERLKTLPKVEINSPCDGLPYIINLSVLGIPSEVLINHLSRQGIYISAGSACKKGHRSEVLRAIGLPVQQIDSAVRVSFSRFSTDADADALVNGIETAIQRFRR